MSSMCAFAGKICVFFLYKPEALISILVSTMTQVPFQANNSVVRGTYGGIRSVAFPDQNLDSPLDNVTRNAPFCF